MRIRNVQKSHEKENTKEEEREVPPFYSSSDFDKPLVIDPLQIHERKHKREDVERITDAQEGGVFIDENGTKVNVQPYRKYDKDMRFDENKMAESKPKKSLQSARARKADARPHTVWVRKDIWRALEVYSEEQDRTMRSCVEEGLYNFLLKEKRVTTVEDMGENEHNSSWVI